MLLNLVCDFFITTSKSMFCQFKIMAENIKSQSIIFIAMYCYLIQKQHELTLDLTRKSIKDSRHNVCVKAINYLRVNILDGLN